MAKKLEIGGGLKNRKDEGYLQMDMKKLPGIDVVGDANELPFEDGELDEIYGHWVLEHFAYRDIKSLLKEWHRALKPGGMVHMVTNNGTAHLKAYEDGVIDIHELNRMIFGVACERAAMKTPDQPEHYTEFKIEDLHKIFWTKELVEHFFTPVFSQVDIFETWKHREDNGDFKCPGIVIKAWK